MQSERFAILTFFAITWMSACSSPAADADPRGTNVGPSARRCAPAPDSIAKAVQHHLRYASDTAAYVTHVFSACGKEAVLVAAGRFPARDREADYGARVVTVRPTADGWIPTSISRGLSDSHLPQLQVYASSDRVLVLADLGDEGGSWGIDTYEVRAGILKELGILDVGIPTNENDQTAFGSVSISIADGRWQAAFAETIVLRPNQDSREVIQLRGAHGIAFRHEGRRWERIP